MPWINNLGNVTEASRLSGVSRDTIYRYRRLLKQGGIEALRHQETPGLRHKNRAVESLEKLVIDFSLQNPHLGQSQVSRQLQTTRDIEISPSGVRNIWLRANLQTMALRMQQPRLSNDHQSKKCQ